MVAALALTQRNPAFGNEALHRRTEGQAGIGSLWHFGAGR
jgi:hypothetical protein